ncbi:unnamed protein product [Nezara viridula]|uniref:Uncharacterized protein n=1 Tax=Nezara viridula TaxID=85310 RepID=A0A9P0HJL5_NEZVI|nr:unnamed protein product [Nezara viridula]
MILQIILIVLLSKFSFAEDRKITMAINPGCGAECKQDSNILIYVRADGLNDTLHHIWDFTNKPTIVLALSPLNTTLMINWTSFKNYEEGALQFSPLPFYTFSYLVDKVIEFNDVNNTAIFDPTVYNKSDSIVHDTNFKWVLDKYVNTTSYASVTMKTDHKHYSHLLKKGCISITLSAFGTMEHSSLQPHLLHTTNATQIDIQFENLSTTKHFKSRFALGLALVSSDSANSTMHLHSRKSLDDEHSPGIFTIGEVKSKQGYLEWRTVAYTSLERSMTNSTGVSSGLFDLPGIQCFDDTALVSLFGSDLDFMLWKELYVSLGEPGDTLYSSNPFISWSFLGGIGVPGNERFSLFILLIVGFGLGVPALLIIIGGIWIVVKRFRQKNDIVFTEM